MQGGTVNLKVIDILQLISAVAPFDTQCEWDNSGLLIGSPRQDVTGILFALDISDAVIDEAMENGADLIVTHHPLMLSPRRRITDEDFEGLLITRLIRSGISHIAAHTNLDQAQGGINDALAEICGLTDITGEGFFRAGNLPEPVFASELAGRLSESLFTTVRLMGPENAVVSRLGVSSGSGSGDWALAKEYECDGFLSGEIKHHNALAMAGSNIAAFECGHFATEQPGLIALAEALQNSLNKIESDIRVYHSFVEPYQFPRQP